MLTHELKTPLSVVSLALGDSGNQPRIRDRARRAVENMRDVIDRCAQSARLVDEGDPAEPASAPEPLDATEVLRAAIQWQVQADRIDLRVPDRPPTCRADRQLLLTIVGNLLENAIKYGPPDGRVHVAIEATYVAGKPGVGISVSNPVGPAGRPDPTHLFRKYRRGARAQHQAGSGLGLYLSRQLARRLEGDLTLRDDTDVRFELWLPS
jgi:signal transduction histidine kinase